LGVPVFSAMIAGFFSGLSLIAAIGAQNAFVLRQGIKREHVGLVVLICAVSDALLIAAGVAGFNAAAQTLPWLVPLFLWGGVAFLLVYGALRFQAGWRGGESLTATGGAAASATRIAATCLALTWLNPHVYLDTLALLGALSAQYAPHELGFGIGAVVASGVFFTALGYGARLLAPVLARPTAWRVLEFIIGAVMWAIAASLVLKALNGGGA
jgi:L-lysine exporter family protein LysE/ArgO